MRKIIKITSASSAPNSAGRAAELFSEQPYKVRGSSRKGRRRRSDKPVPVRSSHSTEHRFSHFTDLCRGPRSRNRRLKAFKLLRILGNAARTRPSRCCSASAAAWESKDALEAYRSDSERRSAATPRLGRGSALRGRRGGPRQPCGTQGHDGRRPPGKSVPGRCISSTRLPASVYTLAREGTLWDLGVSPGSIFENIPGDGLGRASISPNRAVPRADLRFPRPEFTPRAAARGSRSSARSIATSAAGPHGLMRGGETLTRTIHIHLLSSRQVVDDWSAASTNYAMPLVGLGPDRVRFSTKPVKGGRSRDL